MGLFEYLFPMTHTCSRYNRYEQSTGMVKKSSSQAAALLAHGAYSQYVSTAKGRERRWRLFSTFPQTIVGRNERITKTKEW